MSVAAAAIVAWSGAALTARDGRPIVLVSLCAQEAPMARSRWLPMPFPSAALALAVLCAAAPAGAADVEQPLLGVWTVECFATEFKTTGEKQFTFGEKPQGYLAFTPEQRCITILTA
jgi:hypothetical protein